MKNVRGDINGEVRLCRLGDHSLQTMLAIVPTGRRVIGLAAILVLPSATVPSTTVGIRVLLVRNCRRHKQGVGTGATKARQQKNRQRQAAQCPLQSQSHSPG